MHCDGEKGQLQEFILAQMHPLNNVTTVVENSFDVFGIDCAREMRITVVFAVAGRCTDALSKHKTVRRPVQIALHKRHKRVETHEKLVTNEILGTCDVGMLTRVGTRVGRCVVARELGEVVLQSRLAGQHLFGQQVLLVQKENHRYCTQPPTKFTIDTSMRSTEIQTERSSSRTKQQPIVPNAFE